MQKLQTDEAEIMKFCELLIFVANSSWFPRLTESKISKLLRFIASTQIVCLQRLTLLKCLQLILVLFFFPVWEFLWENLAATVDLVSRYSTKLKIWPAYPIILVLLVS